MKKQNIGRRARRSFAPEFKADAVRLVKSGKSPGQVAEALDLTETSLREWIRRADADAGVGSPDVLTTEERQELARLRRENKTLRMERLRRRRAPRRAKSRRALTPRGPGGPPSGIRAGRGYDNAERRFDPK